MSRGLLVALAAGVASAALGACDGGEAPPPEPALVEAVAELLLADARAERTGEPRDSLRAAALEAHGLDSAAFARTLDALAREPAAAVALYDSVAERLAAEGRGE